MLTNLVEKLVDKLFALGKLSHILGAIIGFLEAYLVLFIALLGVKFIAGVKGYEVRPSLGDYILETPVLNNAFEPTFKALSEITSIASDYDKIADKDEYNYKALEILLKYNIVTKDNVRLLVNDDKIDIPNIEELIGEDTNEESTTE